jgi:hypothetical protein
MRKQLTGEPVAGKLHTGFGGRGRVKPFPTPIQRNVDGKSRLIHPAVDDTSFAEKPCKPHTARLFDSYTVVLYRYKFFMKPGTPALQSARLLDQVKEHLQFRWVYGLKTEKAYLYWIQHA